MKKLEINLDEYAKVSNELSIRDYLVLYIKFLNKLNYLPALFHNTMEYHDCLKSLETRQYIKITDDCIIYGDNAQINVECFELRAKSTQIIEIKSINYAELANKLRDIFPAGIRGGGGKLIKSPELAVVDKLKKFFKYYPDVKEESIIKATKNYIENRRRDGWRYTTQLDYFIFKDNVSMLFSEIEGLSTTNREEFSINEMI